VTIGWQSQTTQRNVACATVPLLALLALILLGAPAASAHASLVRATPADGSTVTSVPTRVTLTFDENIRAPSAIVVTDPDGRRVSTGMPEVLDNTASTAVTITRGGNYTVAFRVVSADGHPVSDRTSFRLQGSAASAAASPATTPGSQPQQDDGGAARRRTWSIGIVAAVALVGGLALLTAGRRPKAGTSTRDPA
jgi:copper resistance protein C